MKLYLCEKPSQAKDIAAVLGNPNRRQSYIETDDGVVTWAIGHLLELAEPQDYNEKFKVWKFEDLPILPLTFRNFAKASTKSQYDAVGDLLKKATHVVIATDADREGEMIARELLEKFSYRGKVSRLWLSALDAESIKKALARLKDGSETESLYFAAKARSQGDWLVGMNMTRAVTLRCRGFGSKDVYSIGRVQTPTLTLVVHRDREIDGFRPRDYFEIVADVAADGQRVDLRYAPKDEERIFDRAVADDIAARTRSVTGPLTVEHERKRKAPPKLFSLAGFQIRTNALYGWSADKALTVAQSLYETHKATTYPRTDCEFLPEEQIADVPAIVKNLLQLDEFKNVNVSEPLIRKTVFNTAKISAHHAIIPTKANVDLSSLSADERAGFLLIARSYLAMLLPDYEFDFTKISMNAVGVTFSASGSVPAVAGWKIAFGKEDADGDEDSENRTLPSLANGTPGTIEQTTVEAKKTTPPKRYTEGTLIADMKAVGKFVSDPAKKARLKDTSGIGTEATRAAIIKTLFAREFLVNQKKNILSTAKARKLVELLESHLPALTDPAETAVWEDRLEDIVSGKNSCGQFTASLSAQISGYISALTVSVPVSEQKPTGVEYRGVAVFDGGARWLFPNVDGYFGKELCKRRMSAEDYIKVFDADGELPRFDGFVSAKGMRFSAQLKYNPNKTFNGKSAPGVDFVFEKKK